MPDDSGDFRPLRNRHPERADVSESDVPEVPPAAVLRSPAADSAEWSAELAAKRFPEMQSFLFLHTVSRASLPARAVQHIEWRLPVSSVLAAESAFHPVKTTAKPH